MVNDGDFTQRSSDLRTCALPYSTARSLELFWKEIDLVAFTAQWFGICDLR
jgi:hypothetical protein